MDDLTEARQQLVQLAISIADDYGINFDYSEESVNKIDDILDAIHRDLKAYPNDTDKQEGAYGIALEMGAYIIAVIEKNHTQGEWLKDSDEFGKETWPFTLENMTIFPVGWCVKAIVDGKKEKVWPKYKNFVGSLKS